MGTDNLVFLEMIEWFDETGRELVHRIPEKGSGEIKYGAQLVVRESQAGVFFYNGRAYDAFGPGRHTLTTLNIPILTKVLSLPWGFTSPLRAEVYLVNMKDFINLKWGTKDPVAFKDSELGLIRLRAYGVFNLKVLQPVLFINSIVGTQGMYTTDEIEEYLSRVIVSRLNDHLGEHLDTLIKLPSRYEELSQGLKKRLEEDFSHFGLSLSNLYIVSITPPEEVQKAIDDQSRLAVLKDLDGLVKMKAAMAMEKASQSSGEAGAGMGMGLGFMMPALFADQLRKSEKDGLGISTLTCPECKNPISEESRFCPACGHQIVVFDQCTECGKNLAPKSKFCPRCGRPVQEKKISTQCPHCGTENLPHSVFCNQCGEKLNT
jgi:membrane protease subunit (stomatin/prohibitin family)